MLLKNKTAIIYGAGGSLGGAVAKAFASAGARVFLAGHRLESLQKIAEEIRASINGDPAVPTTGGSTATAGDRGALASEKVFIDQLNAFDETAINEHLERLVQKVGQVDISFNAVGVDVVQNRPLTDISLEDFLSPITLTMKTRFLTAKAAAKIMMQQRSGTILFLTATPAGIGYPYTGGFAPACCAVESLSRNLASELGVYGIRVVNIRSGGSPDSKVFKEAIERDPTAMAPVIRQMEEDTMLKKLPLMEDIANAAVFLASDMAGKITGTTIDVTSGTTAALNYHVSSI